MSAPTVAQARAHIWGVDRRLRTMVPSWLLAIAVATIPVAGSLVRAAVIGAGALVLLIGVITWSGFTAVQWIARRISVAWAGKRQ